MYKSMKENKLKLPLFFYLSIALSIFFLFQIRYTLNEKIENWNSSQYILILLIVCFITVCLIKYHTSMNELSLKKIKLNSEIKQLSFKKSKLKDKLAAMNPYDFGELIADLYRRKGYQRVELLPQMNQHFYDLEMDLNEQKVLISCLIGHHQTIGQAYLDRLYLKMRKNQIDQGIFITLGMFHENCYEFSQNKSIQLINGEEFIDTFLLGSNPL